MYLFSLHVAGQLTPPASTYWFSANINNNSKSLTGLLSYCQKFGFTETYGIQKNWHYYLQTSYSMKYLFWSFNIMPIIGMNVLVHFFFDLWLVFYNFKSNHLSTWNPMMLLYYEALSPVLFKRVKRHIILWRDHTEFNCLWGWESKKAKAKILPNQLEIIFEYQIHFDQ